MKKFLGILLFVLTVFLPTKAVSTEPYYEGPKPDEVGIYYSGVEVPLNKILLIRKDNHYCALKFNRSWYEMDKERLKIVAEQIKQGGTTADIARDSAQKKYAAYESYYFNDGLPNFTDSHILRKEGTASLLPLRGPFRPFIYQPGNGCVECGPYKLLWSYKTFVSVIPLGKSSNMKDYGVELAPTPWSDIKDVNINDSRIKWYRYDENREKVFIPIDKFWQK